MLDTKDKVYDPNHAFIAEVLIDKSKSTPEFKLKAYQKTENEQQQA